MLIHRVERLYKQMESAGMDALVVNPGSSLSYLTGLDFHLMERPTLAFFVPGKKPVLVIPKLELVKLSEMEYEVDAILYDEDPSLWQTSFDEAASKLGLKGKRIGAEPLALRLLELGYIQKACDPKIIDATALIATLRAQKDASELEKIQIATNIAQTALQATLPLVKIGMTEREVAAELVIQLLRAGCPPNLPFGPIVSSGPNSANPHASPSDRKIQSGDLLLFDWGARHDNYISDLTRTFAIGDVDPEFIKIHDIVHQANAAGRAAGKPGAPASLVDIAARQVIEAAGYGKYFTHRTGHGIGLDVHEDPYMRADNLQPLLPGNCYTVEPGIYIAGKNGVRIEDDMYITEQGAVSFSDMPREIKVIA
ncbi:MAG TPA: Xaa-Pro peptidase family protein [Anaerolineales bacterium]|nr:Xaa-Pro peptidase family protein [Anaerolineales bacterium]